MSKPIEDGGPTVQFIYLLLERARYHSYTQPLYAVHLSLLHAVLEAATPPFPVF